jgi:hypothetical protein
MALESPLVHLQRGELKPKVLGLYEDLFKPEIAKSEGYWTEFFLLRCNQNALFSVLDKPGSDMLVQNQEITRGLFLKGVEFLRSDDLFTVENSLSILSVYFQCVFNRNFVSTDIIGVIAGLDKIDGLFMSFLDIISHIITNCPTLSIRVSAIRTITVVAGGVYQTSLASYFLHKNMFAAIMKVSKFFFFWQWVLTKIAEVLTQVYFILRHKVVHWRRGVTSWNSSKL